MKNIWKKQKLWISLLGYVIAAFIIFIFLVDPLVQKIKANSEEIQKRTVDNEINLARVAKLPEMRETHEAFKQEKQSLDMIVDSSREVDLIEKLESLAEETGNKIQLKIIEESNTDQKTNKNPTVAKGKDMSDIRAKLPYDKYLVLQVSLEGGYGNFVNFIYKLENFNYFVNVLSLSLGKEAQSENQEIGGDVFSPVSMEDKNSSGARNNVIAENILKSNIEIAAYVK